MRARRHAGALEDAVLDFLWARGAPTAPGAVHQGLVDEGLALAYTTVTTTLSRLYAKGLVTRSPRGRGCVYSPTDLAAEESARRMRQLLSAGGGGREAVLSRFVAGLSTDEAQVLRGLLDGGGAGA